MQNKDHALSEIDSLMTRFFNVFSSSSDQKADLFLLSELFIPRAVIIKQTDTSSEIMTLHEFITPREKILNDGTLINFKEKELRSDTRIFGRIAQRFCLYEKSGTLYGKDFHTKGMKTVQFIHIDGCWKISALAWDDEHKNLSIPIEYQTE